MYLLKLALLCSGPIRVLGKTILDMRHLQSMFLSNNHLRNIPPEISQLNHLTILDLSSNQLVSVPPEMGDMGTLLHLNLSNNQLKTLPPELGKLFRLKVLNVAGNPLPQELLSFGHSAQGAKKLLQHLLDRLASEFCLLLNVYLIRIQPTPSPRRPGSGLR